MVIEKAAEFEPGPSGAVLDPVSLRELFPTSSSGARR
jgi:hypothetical protein